MFLPRKPPCALLLKGHGTRALTFDLCRRRRLHSLGWFAPAKQGSASKENQTPPRPLVLVLGWAWSTPAQVDKYSSLYNNLGHNTITYILPARQLFSLDHDRVRRAAERLVEQVRDTGAKTLVIHSMSNNGFFLYQKLTELLDGSSQMSNSKESEDDRPKILGTVFDSCPSYFSVAPNLFAPKRHLHRRATVKISPLFLTFAHFYLHYISVSQGLLHSLQETQAITRQLFLNWLHHHVRGNQRAAGQFLLADNQSHYPLLFLYAKGDWSIPSVNVADMADILRERAGAGPNQRVVLDHDFGGASGHVTHLRTDPTRYREEVTKFLELVTKN